MSERLVEIVVPAAQATEVERVASVGGFERIWSQPAGALRVVKILVSAGEVETVLDAVRPALSNHAEARIVVGLAAGCAGALGITSGADPHPPGILVADGGKWRGGEWEVTRP